MSRRRRKYFAPILQSLQKLDQTNIHLAHLSITVMPEGDRKLSINQAVQERPASWAYFTIAQLQEILTRIIHEPERDLFYFIFNRRRIRVKPYIEKPEKIAKPKPTSKDSVETEGLISEIIN